MNKENIIIREKPDSISWEEIRQCLIDAHAENRAKGINMTHYQWPAEKIKSFIGDDSVVLVALDDSKLIGVLALNTIEKKKWYVTGKCGYVGFGAVLHEYNGQGVFRKLYDTIEEKARKKGYDMLIRDTNERNKRMLKISKKEGYSYVDYMVGNDHNSIMSAKWLGECPFSTCYCKRRFLLSKYKAKMTYAIRALMTKCKLKRN